MKLTTFVESNGRVYWIAHGPDFVGHADTIEEAQRAAEEAAGAK